MTLKNLTTLASTGLLFLVNQCNGPDGRIDKIDQLFAKWDSNSPGCGVLVYHDGNIRFQKTFGMANIQDSLLISPTTQFHAASMTKQFTGMAIALLEEKGLIDKRDEVMKYISELPDYGQSITIAHLLNHTSGIPDYQYLEDLAGLDGRQGLQRKTFFALLQSQNSLNNVPGQRYIYSNSNYTLLAMIVEKVTGMTFPEFIRQEIFEPLDMKNSFFISEKETEVPLQMARGYDHTYQVEEPVLNPGVVVGHSGLITTLEDLGKWVDGFMHIKLLADEQMLARPQEGHYDYGLQHFHHYGLPTISHGGVHFGFRSNMLMFPEQDFFVIILGNIDDRDFFYHNYTIADILLEEHYNKVEIEKNHTFDASHLTGKFVNQYLDEVIQVEYLDSTLTISNVQKAEKSTVYKQNENLFTSSSSSGQKSFRFLQDNSSLEITDYDGMKEVFQRASDFNTSEEKMATLAGRYVSKEAGLELNLRIGEDGTINSDFDSEYFNNFQPLTSEIWMNGNVNMMTLKFHYNEDNLVQGFSLSLDRLKNVYFERLE